jgi:hypothetical protein
VPPTAHPLMRLPFPPPVTPPPAQVMKESGGRINPGLMNQVLARKLKEALERP